ncbi:MAG: phosphoglycolate phosphatase [Mesorhizobium amorphae]|nr:MAG: phosphoglycolate phosphatase [Mesorhizobium amorphae]
MTPSFDAVLFDLDGTLVDSAPDLRAALNELLAGYDLPPVPLDAVKGMIGHGVRKLVERAFVHVGHPLDEAALDEEHERMLPIYERNLTGLTTAMPGTLEAMRALKNEGAKLAVVTNKPAQFTQAVLEHYGFLPLLDFWIGGDGGVAKKPAPDMLLRAVERLGSRPARAVMVGDSSADVISAHAGAIKAVIVEGGYTPEGAGNLGADAVIATMHELPGALSDLAQVNTDTDAMSLP